MSFLSKNIDHEFSRFLQYFCIKFHVDLEDAQKFAKEYTVGGQEECSSTVLPTPAVCKSTESGSQKETSVVSKVSSIGEECGYTVKPRNGKPSHLCGKKAKNMVDGIWYCGNLRADGSATAHLGSAIKSAKKKMLPPNKVKEAVTEELLKGTRELSPPLKKTSEPPTVLKRVEKQNTVNVHKVQGTNFYIDKTTRIIIDPDSKKATGILDKDNKTVKPLDSDSLRFLEAHNIEAEIVEKEESEAEEEVEVVEYETEEESYEEVEEEDE